MKEKLIYITIIIFAAALGLFGGLLLYTDNLVSMAVGSLLLIYCIHVAYGAAIAIIEA